MALSRSGPPAHCLYQSPAVCLWASHLGMLASWPAIRAARWRKVASRKGCRGIDSICAFPCSVHMRSMQEEENHSPCASVSVASIESHSSSPFLPRRLFPSFPAEHPGLLSLFVHPENSKVMQEKKTPSPSIFQNNTHQTIQNATTPATTATAYCAPKVVASPAYGLPGAVPF
jgi:hypothetical protein